MNRQCETSITQKITNVLPTKMQRARGHLSVVFIYNIVQCFILKKIPLNFIALTFLWPVVTNVCRVVVCQFGRTFSTVVPKIKQ
jgi:hypothetical protein